MSQDPQQALALLGGVVAGPQGRVQQALVPRDHAFDLPAMTVDSLREPAFHQPAVLGLGPTTPRVPAVQRNGGAAYPQLFSTQDVVAFAVVAGVGQQAGQTHMSDCLTHGRGELGMVVAGASHHPGASNQVGWRVTDDGQLGPAATAKTLVSTAFHEVGADVVGLQAGGVDGAFGLGSDQPALCRTLEDDAPEPVESPFFTSRCSA